MFLNLTYIGILKIEKTAISFYIPRIYQLNAISFWIMYYYIIRHFKTDAITSDNEDFIYNHEAITSSHKAITSECEDIPFDYEVITSDLKSSHLT